MSQLSRAERETLRLLNSPLEDTPSIALQCTICRHVRVVETGTTVSCQHGGEWIPMRVAPDQTAARARVKTQIEAAVISVQEPLL